MNSFDRIYEVVCRIPVGKVATYGQIACLAGNPRWARVVGYALHRNPGLDFRSLMPIMSEKPPQLRGYITKKAPRETAVLFAFKFRFIELLETTHP